MIGLLSFDAHVQSLCSKFYPRHKALRSIATAFWGPTKEPLSLLYKAFVWPVLIYASAGWFPFLCNTATNHLEVLRRAACRVIIGCPTSTPSSLLLLEAQLPPLKLTLEHQALSSFKRPLRLPPNFSSLNALTTRNVPCRLKEKPSWRSFCSSATQSLPSPRETLIICPPFPPWTATYFLCFPLHSRLHRQQNSPITACFKQTNLAPPLLISKQWWSRVLNFRVRIPQKTSSTSTDIEKCTRVRVPQKSSSTSTLPSLEKEIFKL